MKINKKILVGMFVVVLLIGIGVATNFLNHDDAYTYYDSYYAARETNLSNEAATITYESDMICTIEYYSGRSDCKIDFSFEFNRMRYYSSVTVPYGTSQEDYEALIRNDIRTYLDFEVLPIEEITYTADSLTGNNFSR